ncbi:MAG: hypothetical protein DRG78_08480 [Epsilonproteobacteria bacterium]|nr:MAG: hypothetical protein DRG78_08480 [Campylobacterota bacterium]
MNFNIINESAYQSVSVELLEESTFGGEQRIKFKAKLQERDVTNNNGRSYSDEVLRLIVEQLAPKATERKLVGELDHPSPQGDTAAKMKRSSTISLKDACVLFTSIEYDGKFIIATCETLTNDSGMNLYRLLKDKVTIGFSLRAFGSSTKSPTGVTMVSPMGLKALTFDVVSNPSHSSAVIYEFITESTDPLSLINDLQDYKKEVVEIITESTIDSTYQTYTNGEQLDTCACSIDGSCVAGTIEESIDFLISRSLEKNTIKSFSFKI